MSDLEFKYPGYILFLLPALATLAFYILSFRKKERISAVLQSGFRIRYKTIRAFLLGAGLALMVAALMGPQVFTGYAEFRKIGMDIFVLIDTSKSMLVSDIAPDRLTRAKRMAAELLDHLEGDRVGYIPFASDAYIQMPLTDDYQLARMFLDVVDTDMISGGGTNLAAAIRLARDSFNRISAADKIILILSDGEEHESAGLDVLRGIEDEQLKIYTVGVGTEKGGLVPVYSDDGAAVIDYMRDESGNPVTSRLQADTLNQLAKEGGGAYYPATLQGGEIDSLMKDISALQRDEYETMRVSQFRPLYQYFLGMGLLCFLLAWFLPEAGFGQSKLQGKRGEAA
ncbi:MAG: VWA domain-containing protein [Clostridiales bacterium]|nr:VWA domain-containing protein [Clostridiales bacterium]